MPFKAADPRSEKINNLVRLKARGGRQHSTGSIFNKSCVHLVVHVYRSRSNSVFICGSQSMFALVPVWTRWDLTNRHLSPMQWDKYFIAMHLLNMELYFKGITCRNREGLYDISVFT